METREPGTTTLPDRDTSTSGSRGRRRGSTTTRCCSGSSSWSSAPSSPTSPSSRRPARRSRASTRSTVEVPADAPPLRVGQAVRIGGKLAGLISGVEPDRENGGTMVTANITKTEFRPIGERRDRQRPRPLDRLRTPTSSSTRAIPSEPMQNGGVIEQANVTSGVDLLEVVQLFDEEARESLRETVVNIGYGARRPRRRPQRGAQRPRPGRAQPRRPARGRNRDEGALGDGVAGAAAVSGPRGRRRRRRRRPDRLRRRRPRHDRRPLDRARRRDPPAAPLRGRVPRDGPGRRAAARRPRPADAASSSRPSAASTRRCPTVNRLLGLGDELRDRERPDHRGRDPGPARPRSRWSATSIPIVASLDPLLDDVDTIVEARQPLRRTSTPPARGWPRRRASPSRRAGLGAGAPMGRVIPCSPATRTATRSPSPAKARGLGAMLSLAGKRMIGIAAIVGGILIVILGVSKPNPFEDTRSVLGRVRHRPGPRRDRPRRPPRRRQRRHDRRGQAGGRRRDRRADPRPRTSRSTPTPAPTCGRTRSSRARASSTSRRAARARRCSSEGGDDPDRADRPTT